MDYFFAGGEVPSHRKILGELKVEHVALSYMGLRRRVKFARPWIIDDKFHEEAKLFLDSGAYTVNNGNTEFTPGDLFEISEHYQEFVADNIDRLTMVSEFDALQLGQEWIEEQRSEFYDDLPRDKFMAIWHVDYGLDNLKELCQKYERVGVPALSLNGRDLTPYLNSLVAETDVKLHAIAMTKPDEMEQIRWASVSSTSWVSPQQYGDTIVWTGRELKRYPKDRKEQARKRYRTLFENEGFDSEAIENDDHRELLRLSVWSWQKLVAYIAKKQGEAPSIVTNPFSSREDPFVEVEGDEVANPPEEVGKSVATVQRATTTLPVIGVTTTEVEEINPESGETTTSEVSTYGIRKETARKCNSCFLSSKCPAYEPNNSCAFDIPIEIKTRPQFIAMQNSLIEMQTQRVMFMRFAEEIEGGYADPNLSSEMDRLQKMLKTKHDMEQEGFTFKIEAKSTGGSGQQGMLARMFGEQASARAQALPSPVPADIAIEQVMEPGSDGVYHVGE